jgi:hypothetical protein
MKSPWQLGFLALAVTGVSAYDYVFFKNYRAQQQAPAPMSVTQPAALLEEPLLSPPPESDGSEGERAPDENDYRPFISREELHQRSRQAYVSKGSPDDRNFRWPARDPFAARAEQWREPVAYEIPEVTIHTSTPAPKPQAPPPLHCVFSGSLGQGTTKLALVDGTPMSIGEHLGAWKLARIEPDYIVFEAGNEMRRVGLKGAETPPVPGKDPL